MFLLEVSADSLFGPRGRSVLSVAMDIDGLDHHYSTQDTVEEACSQHLGDRFSLGKRAPLDAPQLQILIGNLSDTEAAQSLLGCNCLCKILHKVVFTTYAESCIS